MDTHAPLPMDPETEQAHALRSIPTIILARTQLAQRALRSGRAADVECQLSEVEHYIRQCVHDLEQEHGASP